MNLALVFPCLRLMAEGSRYTVVTSEEDIDTVVSKGMAPKVSTQQTTGSLAHSCFYSKIDHNSH